MLKKLYSFIRQHPCVADIYARSTKLNVYEHSFECLCPNNGARISYRLRIETDRVIMVEKIVLACELWNEAYHESLADNLYYQFGGRQTLWAHHHGVDIKTVRGA